MIETEKPYFEEACIISFIDTAAQFRPEIRAENIRYVLEGLNDQIAVCKQTCGQITPALGQSIDRVVKHLTGKSISEASKERQFEYEKVQRAIDRKEDEEHAKEQAVIRAEFEKRETRRKTKEIHDNEPCQTCSRGRVDSVHDRSRGRFGHDFQEKTTCTCGHHKDYHKPSCEACVAYRQTPCREWQSEYATRISTSGSLGESSGSFYGW